MGSVPLSLSAMMTVMVPDLLEPTDQIRGLCTIVARDLHEVRRLIRSLRRRSSRC